MSVGRKRVDCYGLLKNQEETPLSHLPFSFLPCPSINRKPDCSSRPIHTLAITLPLTLKPSLPSTLTFPTLTDFLGELEPLFWPPLSLSFSGNYFYLRLHAYLRDVFLFSSCAFYHSANPFCTVRASICLAGE